MKDKIKIRCFNDAEQYFKLRSSEEYREYIADLDRCLEDNFQIDWLEHPTFNPETETTTFATGGFDWPLFCVKITSLQKSYLEEVEFVH